MRGGLIKAAIGFHTKEEFPMGDSAGDDIKLEALDIEISRKLFLVFLS